MVKTAKVGVVLRKGRIGVQGERNREVAFPLGSDNLNPPQNLFFPCI
jgi:hypothetical protein